MSTIRIKDLPDGTATFTNTAKIPYEDPNDASDTTKFLTVTDIGGQFLLLAGGTMSGDILMAGNNIDRINDAKFLNAGSGNNPTLSSNATDRELTLTGDLNLENTGAEIRLSGGSIISQDDFTTNFTITDFYNFSSSLDEGGSFGAAVVAQFDSIRNEAGEFAFFDFTARNNINAFTIYGGLIGEIINPLNGNEDGAWRMSVIRNGNDDQVVVGFNELGGLETQIYGPLHILNQSTGADPILFADFATQKLDLTGSFRLLIDDTTAIMELEANHTTPVINDEIGMIDFIDDNDAAQRLIYTQIRGGIEDPTDGSEEGELRIFARHLGALSSYVVINLSGNDQIALQATVNLTGNTMINSRIQAAEITNFLDFTRTSIPANPATNFGRMYVKQIDSDNDGVFTIIKKAGSFTEVQIA